MTRCQVIGPFGSGFSHAQSPRASHIVMICTGTGSSAHARHDGIAPPPAQRRQASSTTAAVLRCAHAFRSCPNSALQNLPMISSTSTSPSRAWPASPGAVCAERHARALGRSHGVAARTTTRTSMSAASKAWRTASCLALRDGVAQQARPGLGGTGRQTQARSDVCTWKPIEGLEARANPVDGKQDSRHPLRLRSQLHP